MQYVFSEPKEYGFKDVNGHDGKFFGTSSPRTNHLIIEWHDRLTVSLIKNESEFNYYILDGKGFFTIQDQKQPVHAGNLVVISPGTKYSFSGQLKMLLMNTPHWSETQEQVIRD